MLETEIVYFGRRYLCVCDARCTKAWGLNGGRPKMRLSDDPDDYAFLADGEVGEAPDSGVTEGGDGKPRQPPARHNRWCVRECERSVLIHPGETIRVPDFAYRVYNMPQTHDAEVHDLTGAVFAPPAGPNSA